MKRFELTIVETMMHRVELDANDKEEAKKKLLEMIDNGDFDFSYGESDGFEISAVKEVKQ